jgi:hypothetical protein
MTHEAGHLDGVTTTTTTTAVAAPDAPAVDDLIEAVSWVGRTVDYIQNALVSIVFGLLFVSLIIYIVKLHFGNGTYKKFRLADMICRGDGSLDRKAFERLVLFLATLYGFLYVVHHERPMIVTYLVAMAGIWLAHQLADNKIANKNVPPTPLTPESTGQNT